MEWHEGGQYCFAIETAADRRMAQVTFKHLKGKRL